MNQQQLIVNLSILPKKPTGIGNYIKNIFPHLKKLAPTLLSADIHHGFDCYPIPNDLTSDQGKKGHFKRLLWTQFQLPEIYQKQQAELLFSPIPEAPLYTKSRFIVTSFDLIPLHFPNYTSLLSWYHKYYTPTVFQQAEHIICISEATAKDVHQFYGIPQQKITPILLAYDAQHFRPVIDDHSNFQASKKPYFLYIGRHDPHKNVHRIITAFAKLTSSLKIDVQLWLVGPQDNRHTPLLKQQIKELGLTEQVELLDYVSYGDLPKIISGAIALVFPSLWEGFGLPVLEAMGCGTPVITSNLSSLPEVAGDAAILVDPYNVAELTDAMQAITNDAELRSQLSRLGLARVSQFSWEKTGQATAEVLQRFL